MPFRNWEGVTSMLLDSNNLSVGCQVTSIPLGTQFGEGGECTRTLRTKGLRSITLDKPCIANLSPGFHKAHII